jgi:neutral trehalase
MAEMARILGEDPTPFEERSRKTAQAIEEKLWDEERGVYLDCDLATDRLIHVFS